MGLDHFSSSFDFTRYFLVLSKLRARLCLRWLVPILGFFCIGAAYAATDEAVAEALLSMPVVQGGGVVVRTADVAVDSLRIPVEARKGFLEKSATVKQIASNLFVRRALADEAERQGLDRVPEVAVALQLARDKVLSDAKLARTEKAALPTVAAIDAYAETLYRAGPERFKVSEENRVRHILVAKNTPDARMKADGLLEQLKAGADFAKLAQDNSDDPGSAAKGGDLGFFGEGRVVKPFQDSVFALKNPGDLSPVVESQFGYHIILLEERRPARIRPFEEVRESLRAEAQGKLTSEARQRETDQLLGTAQFDDAAIEKFSAQQR
jgi:peptidyl-prolyl cis-trans isomerase C